MNDSMTQDELSEMLLEGVQDGLWIAHLDADGDLAYVASEHVTEQHKPLTLLEIQVYQAMQGGEA